MERWLISVIIIICFTIGLAESKERNFESKKHPIEPLCWPVYKTKEEIAWEIVIYAIKNIPSMSFRIIHYEDLLEAYRKTLNVIEQPDKPVPTYKEKEE